jgi:MFS family permease
MIQAFMKSHCREVGRHDTSAPVAAGLRMLLWGRGISALGDGLWFTIWALFFTRILGLPLATVGVGMAIAGAAGMIAAIPLGGLADRISPKTVLTAITAVRALAMASYLLVDDTWSFLAVTIPFTALATGGAAVRTALIAGLVGDNTARVRAMGFQRVAQHVGYAIGAGAGALVVTADVRWVYETAIVGNAVTFAILAITTMLVPEPKPIGTAARSGIAAALADRPYLCVVTASALLSLCWAMLSTGLPLWISDSTHLPLALGGAVVVISSIGIAVFQVPAARFARTTSQAARTIVVSGTVLAASCLLLATTTASAGALGIGIVIVAGLLHVTGELGYVAAAWGLSINLMREDARGAYQGAAESAIAVVQMFGPGVFTLALGGFGAGGWLLVAVIFLAAALPVPALTRWAIRTREPISSAATPPHQTTPGPRPAAR